MNFCLSVEREKLMLVLIFLVRLSYVTNDFLNPRHDSCEGITLYVMRNLWLINEQQSIFHQPSLCIFNFNNIPQNHHIDLRFEPNISLVSPSPLLSPSLSSQLMSTYCLSLPPMPPFSTSILIRFIWFSIFEYSMRISNFRISMISEEERGHSLKWSFGK